MPSTTVEMPVAGGTIEAPMAPNAPEPVLLGQRARMPEFSLAGKVVCVSGAGRGLGLTQAEALLEAGAKVYALDRLEEPVRPSCDPGHSRLRTPSSLT